MVFSGKKNHVHKNGAQFKNFALGQFLVATALLPGTTECPVPETFPFGISSSKPPRKLLEYSEETYRVFFRNLNLPKEVPVTPFWKV